MFLIGNVMVITESMSILLLTVSKSKEDVCAIKLGCQNSKFTINEFPVRFLVEGLTEFIKDNPL